MHFKLSICMKLPVTDSKFLAELLPRYARCLKGNEFAYRFINFLMPFNKAHMPCRL